MSNRTWGKREVGMSRHEEMGGEVTEQEGRGRWDCQDMRKRGSGTVMPQRKVR